jgi:tetratricopeptide (TPR) repeat protein
LIDYCFNLIQKGQDEKDLQEIIGALYLQINDIERAKYIFTQVITHYSEQDIRFSYRQLLEIAKREKDAAAVRKILQRYERQFPDDFGVLLELGYYFEAFGEIDKALDFFKRANQLSYSEIIAEKITRIQNKKMESKLQEEMQKIAAAPTTPANRLKIAGLKYQSGDFQGCLDDCAMLLSEGFNVNEVTRFMGLAHYSKNEYLKAAECLGKYLSHSQESKQSEINKEARYYLGMSYLKQNLLELSVREFQELLVVDPNYRDVKEKIHINIVACPYCSRKISSQDVFCPHCKARVRHEGNVPVTNNEVEIGVGSYLDLESKSDENSPLELDDTSSNAKKQNTESDES